MNEVDDGKGWRRHPEYSGLRHWDMGWEDTAFEDPDEVDALADYLNELEAKARPNKADVEDCEACGVVGDGPCLYHEGVSDGIQVAREAVLKTLDGDL